MRIHIQNTMHCGMLISLCHSVLSWRRWRVGVDSGMKLQHQRLSGITQIT